MKLIGHVFQAVRAVLSARIAFVGVVLCIAAMTLIGPFGTFTSLELGMRALYWSAVISVSVLIAIAVRRLVRSFRLKLEEWPGTLIAATAFTAVFAPLLAVFNEQVSSFQGSGPPAMGLLQLAAVIFLVPVAVTAMRHTMRLGLLQRLHLHSMQRPRLLERLEDKAASTVRYMTVRDHYVDVFTDRGKDALLMRFSDAIGEVGSVTGFQVHRSHWVAREAISQVERDRGRVFLRLDCGRRVPVSRAYHPVIEDAGLPVAKSDGSIGIGNG